MYFDLSQYARVHNRSKRHVQILSNEDFENFWRSIPVGKELYTPDKGRGKAFIIVEVSPDWVRVRAKGSASILVDKTAFIAALRFLAEGQNYEDRPCLIASSIQLPGMLGYETRKVNRSKVAVIAYILPILKNAGLVEINSGRPNLVWLV